MSEIHTQIKETEEAIKATQEIVEQRERMLRLVANADFKELVLEGFCRDECARYAKLSIDPSLKPEDRADSLGIAQAAGYFQRWINAYLQMSEHAANNQAQLKELLDELRALPEEA